MMIQPNPTVSNRFTEHMRQSDVRELLEEYMDIQCKLESSLESFHWLQEEIQFAMEDISTELEELQIHLSQVSSRLKRYRIPLQYEVVKEQDKLPFD